VPEAHAGSAGADHSETIALTPARQWRAAMANSPPTHWAVVLLKGRERLDVERTGDYAAQLSADAEREKRIRERAYPLWEEDGSPEGRAEEFWHRARQILDKEAERNGAIS
jgi:hypothetical protein